MKMDIRGFSLNIKDVLKEASAAMNSYDLVVLFARIWFRKAVILEREISSPSSMSKLEENFMNRLQEGCRSLQKALSLKPVEKTEDQMLKLVEHVAHLVESHYEELVQPAEFDSVDLVSEILYKFLARALLLKAEMLLSELLKDEIEALHPLKNQIGAFREGLILLIKSEMNQRKQEDVTEEVLALKDIEGLTMGAISLCNSCRADINTEVAVKEIKSQLSCLLVDLQTLKDTMEYIYFETPISKSPRPSELGCIKSLLERFKDLHRQPRDSLACAAHQIEGIQDDLEYIMCEYSHIFTEESGNQKCRSIQSQLVDHAHQVHQVMDKMQVESDPTSQQLLWLYHLSKQIKNVRDKQLPQINDSVINNPAVVVKTALSRYNLLNRSSSSALQHEEFVVGFDHKREVIIDRLLRKTKMLEVVLISGMPRAGKTTLAQTVFNDHGIQLHFHVRAWCSVNQGYKKRDLWVSILRQMEIEDDMFAEMLTKKDEDLLRQLSDLLSHKRYLIVMDDVWGTAAWHDLRVAFPDGANQSRILMTSRLNNVVPNPIRLHGLSDEQSWKLLTLKIFGHEGCPEELWDLGQKIVKKCKGLPIAINAVAGLLVATNKDRWQEISELGSSEIFNDLIQQNLDVFEQSYNYLRRNSKDCFRYLGMFPRDEDILVRRLLWLLIAEGFIVKEEDKSLEDTAEEYLKTLIDSSLVIATKRGSNGKIKTCQVHGLVLDFCLLKATNSGFLQKISNASHFRNAEHYRLSICSDPEPFIAARRHCPSVRSLLFFTSNEMYPGCHNDLSLIPENFRFLHVLDLESVNVGNTLVKLIDHLPLLLRYLGVAGDMDTLPPSLSELQYLVTLVVKGLMNKFLMPAAIWRVTSLRHIHVSNHCLFTIENDEDGSESRLDSLVSLSMPSFSYMEETKNTFMRLPNVQNLKCALLEPQVGSDHIRQFPEFGLLKRLESLKLSYSGRPFYPVKWRLPSGLKELSLSNFRLPWDQISALIKELPNLEILKLVSRAFEGTAWEMREGEFQSLRYLKLESLNIVRWDADDDQLPNLEHLVLRKCKQLRDVPSSFGVTCTLQKIEVHRCGISVEEAVKRFVEEQREFGNNDLTSNIS